VPVPLPATITVPAKAAEGDLLSNWVATSMPTRYLCTVTAGASSAGGATSTMQYNGGNSLTDTTVIAPDAGRAKIAVFETGVPGIGIAVAGAAYGNTICATCTNYQAYSSLSNQLSYASAGYSNGGTSPYTGRPPIAERVAVALVRTKGPVGAGPIDLDGVVIAKSRMGVTGSPPPLNYFGTVLETEYVLGGKTSVVRPSCTTSDVEVNFGAIPAANFTGVGSTPAQRDFNLTLTGCPAIATMTYQLDSVITPVDEANGVLALNTGGATGLGVRVRRISGSTESTLAFGTAYAVPGFAGLAGNYTVPLRAALYQTESIVTPGKIEAEATFTIDYR